MLKRSEEKSSKIQLALTLQGKSKPIRQNKKKTKMNVVTINPLFVIVARRRDI